MSIVRRRTAAAVLALTAALAPVAAGTADAALNPDGTQRKGVCTTTVTVDTTGRTTSQVANTLYSLATKAIYADMSVKSFDVATGTLVVTNFDWDAARNAFAYDYRVADYETECMAVIQGGF